ncbi:MAG: ATP-binding protein [Deltaproteobacteria bacterium]
MMRQVGLRAEILFNLLFITAVAMFIIGIIAFKITERATLRGKAQEARAVIKSFEVVHARRANLDESLDFLRGVLKSGVWGVIAYNKDRRGFQVEPVSEDVRINIADPMILEVMKTGRTAIRVEGVSAPPFSYYRGLKIASSVADGEGGRGVILLYLPFSFVEENLILSQRLIATSIIINLAIIAVFGFYILSRRIVKPVEKLIAATEQIAAGRFPEEENPGGVKEINLLHSALRKMYGEIEANKQILKENIEALRESNEVILRARKELIESEKLASLGKLAAGVGHEIGNPLSAIRGYVEVLKRGFVSDESKRDEFLGNIQRETDRIDLIIRTLLDYARPRDFQARKSDINAAVRRSIEILSAQGALKRVRLSLQLDASIPQVYIDPNQLTQVMINLILNATDAVAEINGEISVSTLGTEAGDVEIRVADNGYGIPPNAADRVFDPFFTTKEPGKGTGLGLSVCQRIVKLFGGEIRVERSGTGEGAVFLIKFPGVQNP